MMLLLFRGESIFLFIQHVLLVKVRSENQLKEERYHSLSEK